MAAQKIFLKEKPEWGLKSRERVLQRDCGTIDQRLYYEFGYDHRSETTI